jgi:hypothetical protein
MGRRREMPKIYDNNFFLCHSCANLSNAVERMEDEFRELPESFNFRHFSAF